jgi:ribosome-associated protein
MAAAETSAVADLQAELPEHVRGALSALAEHKGQALVVLDMRGVSGFTDFMVLATGRSEPQVQALADAVEEKLLEMGEKPRHVEGRNEARWILLDYLDLIVHVFTPETRDFYQLEKLWRDAPMLEWGEAAS